MAFWLTLLIFIGSTVIGELLRPRNRAEKPKPSGLGDFQLPTADATRSIPAIFGTVLARGPNVVWYGDLTVQPITQKVKTGLFSSETITTGYRYFLGMQLVLCQGLVDVFRSIRFEDKFPTITTSTVGDALRIDMGPTGGGLFSGFLNPNRRLFGGDTQGGGVAGLIDLYLGSGSQAPCDYLEAKVATPFSGYPQVCYAVFRHCYLGTSPYLKPVAFEVSRYPNTLGLTGSKHIIAVYDANPACVLYEILTDPVYGLGLSSSLIDLPSFQAAGNTLFDEDLGVSIQYDSPNVARDAVDDLLRHIDGLVYTDPVSGLLTLKLARADYVIGSLPLFDDDDVSEVELSRPSWTEISNDIHATYVSREDGYTVRVAQQQNLAAIQIVGERRTENVDFKAASRASVANALTARTLKTLSYPLARVTIKINRVANALRPGSVFRLTWPALGLVGLVLRVVRPRYGELQSGTITLDCVEDIFAISSAAFSPPAGTGWTDPSGVPAPVLAQTLLEAPFHVLGSSDRQVLAAAVRPTGASLGYDIVSDRSGGTAYELTNEVRGFTPSGSLVSSYGASTSARDATGFVIDTDAVDLDQLPADVTDDELFGGVNLCLIGSELLAFGTVTDNGDGTWTISDVVRGVLDTVPAAHSSGARVWFLLPGGSAVLDPSSPYAADGTVTAKLLPFTMTSGLDAASATAASITTASRAQKPYPPGNVMVAGSAWPASVTGGVDIPITWAHRHRLLQFADLLLVAQDAGDYSASPEGDYTVEIRVGGVLKRTAAAIAGTSFNWSAAFQVLDSATVGASVSVRVIPKNGALVGTYQERLFSIA